MANSASRKTRTGSSAMAMDRRTTGSAQDLQRHHRLARRATVLERRRCTEGERQVQRGKYGEPHIDLSADVRKRPPRPGCIEIRHETSGEHRRTQPGRVETRRSRAAEAYRRQVPLRNRLQEIAPRNLVQASAREAVV